MVEALLVYTASIVCGRYHPVLSNITLALLHDSGCVDKQTHSHTHTHTHTHTPHSIQDMMVLKMVTGILDYVL